MSPFAPSSASSNRKHTHHRAARPGLESLDRRELLSTLSVASVVHKAPAVPAHISAVQSADVIVPSGVTASDQISNGGRTHVSLAAGAGLAPAHVGPALAPSAIWHDGPAGGTGGYLFDDGPAIGRIADVLIRSGAYIDSILVIEENPTTIHPQHGGDGGHLDIFTLASDEYITEVSGRYGRYVDSLTIQTNKGQIGHWGGSGGVQDFDFQAPSGYAIVGFWGRSGAYVDAIGVIVAPVPAA